MPVRQIVRRFWPDARPYRKWLLVSLAGIVLVPAIDAAMIWMFKLVVDRVLRPADLGAFWPLAGAYLGLALLASVVTFIDEYTSTWVGERFLLGLRTRVFRHVQGLSLDFFERRRLGDTLARLTGDVAAIESFVLSGLVDALSAVVSIALFTALLFVLSWQLALASLIVLPAFWAAARWFSRRIKEASRERRRHSGSISAAAEESLGNAPLVQAYNRQDHEAERFHQQGERTFQAQMASTRLRALYSPVVGFIELVGGLVVMGVGTWQLSSGALTLGGLLAFLVALSRLYSPVKSLSKLSTTIYSASAGAERVIELLDHAPAVADGSRALGRVAGMVELESVTFTYPGAGPALRDVDLRVEPGSTVALVGRSGAGKTTLAKLLLRFYDPDAGAVRLDGVDMREARLDSLRANVALLLQETLVFDGTIRENIAYGRPEATDEEIERAARAAEAHEFITGLKDGYDTPVGQRGRRLSGGQRQRIAIARALIRDAPVLILDEPTSAMDAESGDRMLTALGRLMEGRTTIVISHDLLLARRADEVVVLDGGTVVERGTHDELLAADGDYAHLWWLRHGEAAVSA
ncbi:MAG TPA: ABC transporter ATP-binding protein [Miltoncostaeaceae bacterium]|nr:ABC transporter ATP-binding protein [Miltoncostaeaceae bacterium]